MRRRVKDFFEIQNHLSLDALIATLVEIRAGLPQDADPSLSMIGDDVFGRVLSIAYFRPPTIEEAERDARYGDAAPWAAPRSGTPGVVRLPVKRVA